MRQTTFDHVVQTQLKQRRQVQWFFGHIYNFHVHYNKSELLALKDSPVIFVGNHVSPWDMWVNFPALDDETFEALAPIRFVGSTSFRTRWLHYLNPLIARIYKRHQVITYPKRGSGDKTMSMEEKQAPIIEALNMGHKVVIYAEGHTRKHEDPPVRPFKRGAAYLHKVTGAPVVPFALGYRGHGRFKKNDCVCVFGEPVSLSYCTEETITRYLEDTVRHMLKTHDAR